MPAGATIGGLIGGVVGTALGPVGSVGGGAVGGLIGGLFDEAPEARGGSLFDGLQQPGRMAYDANGLTKNDAQVFANGANRLGLWVQEIDTLIHYDMDHSHNPWATVVDWYRNRPLAWQVTLDNYNADNPGAPLRPHPLGAAGAALATGSLSGVGAVAPAPVPAPVLAPAVPAPVFAPVLIRVPAPAPAYATAPAPAPAPAPGGSSQDLTLPNVTIQTGGTNGPLPAAKPNYVLYGACGIGALVLVLILVLALKGR